MTFPIALRQYLTKIVVQEECFTRANGLREMQSIVPWEAWQQEWEPPHTVFAISKQSQANDGPQLATSIFLVSPGPQYKVLPCTF